MERAFVMSLKITIIYLVVGSVWILFSDELLGFLVQDAHTVKVISIFKGWLFVVITGIMLYSLVKRHMLLLVDSETAVRERNRELARTEEELRSQIIEQQKTESALQTANQQVRRLNAELEQRVEQRTAQLEEANKELESFSYSVSHDLRAPLRHIEGFSQVLLEDYQERLDEEGQKHLLRLQKASQRMSQLIDDLLELSRVGRSELDRQETDLSTLSAMVLQELEQNQPKRKVKWQVGDHVTAIGDSRLLRVVLENLLGNAWKYTARKEEASIEFGSYRQGEETVYFVRDNGAGFDMRYADKLFAPFQRLHRADEFEGTGVGLATVKRIIARHGGRIWAESAPDAGATFHFTLSEVGR